MSSRSTYIDVLAALGSPRLSFLERYRLRKAARGSRDPVLRGLVSDVLAEKRRRSTDPEMAGAQSREALKRYCQSRVYLRGDEQLNTAAGRRGRSCRFAGARTRRTALR